MPSMRDFPGSPVVKTEGFHCRGTGINPGQGTGIPHAAWHSKKIKNNNKDVIIEVKQSWKAVSRGSSY